MAYCKVDWVLAPMYLLCLIIVIPSAHFSIQLPTIEGHSRCREPPVSVNGQLAIFLPHWQACIQRQWQLMIQNLEFIMSSLSVQYYDSSCQFWSSRHLHFVQNLPSVKPSKAGHKPKTKSLTAVYTVTFQHHSRVTRRLNTVSGTMVDVCRAPFSENRKIRDIRTLANITTTNIYCFLRRLLIVLIHIISTGHCHTYRFVAIDRTEIRTADDMLCTQFLNTCAVELT